MFYNGSDIKNRGIYVFAMYSSFSVCYLYAIRISCCINSRAIQHSAWLNVSKIVLSQTKQRICFSMSKSLKYCPLCPFRSFPLQFRQRSFFMRFTLKLNSNVCCITPESNTHTHTHTNTHTPQRM